MSDPTAHWPATADQALAELRAAKLRRDLKREGLGNVYVHVARPGLQLSTGRTVYGSTNWANVSRSSNALVATVRFFGNSELVLLPSELRDLAARLIDAAHDIEANPVHTVHTVQQHAAAQAVAA